MLLLAAISIMIQCEKKPKRDSSGNVICNDENDDKRIATFHFPTDNNLKQKWIKFVCRGKDYAPTTNSVICF